MPNSDSLSALTSSSETLFAVVQDKAVSVHSVDADNCLFNSNYRHIGDRTDKDVIEHNGQLVQHIVKQSVAMQACIIMVGSARQDRGIDQHNAIKNRTDSCFRGVTYLHSHVAGQLSHLTCELDGYLLADTYADRQDEHNFKKALAYLQDKHYQELFYSRYERSYDKWVFDKSKLSILYAQMHKVAARHPMKKVHFHFYDDNISILWNLSQFLCCHPVFIPKNVELHLHQYEGESVLQQTVIRGSGLIDQHYADSVKRMAKLVTNNRKLNSHEVLRPSWDFISGMSRRKIGYFLRSRRRALQNVTREDNFVAASMTMKAVG